VFDDIWARQGLDSRFRAVREAMLESVAETIARRSLVSVTIVRGEGHANADGDGAGVSTADGE